MGCDLQIFSNCFFELAEGLFDSGGLVEAVDRTGMQLMGLAKGLQSCGEAPAVQVGLAQTLPADPVFRVRPQRGLQAAIFYMLITTDK